MLASGFQTWIGVNNIKTSKYGVSFSPYRSGGYSTIGTNIPYTNVYLTAGGGLDLNKGNFTAPVQGMYFCLFTARAESDGTQVELIIGGTNQTVTSYGTLAGDNMPLHMTRYLDKDMTISVRLTTGSIYDEDYPNSYTQYTGFPYG